jgi:hypothetical protein
MIDTVDEEKALYSAKLAGLRHDLAMLTEDDNRKTMYFNALQQKKQTLLDFLVLAMFKKTKCRSPQCAGVDHTRTIDGVIYEYCACGSVVNPGFTMAMLY